MLTTAMIGETSHFLSYVRTACRRLMRRAGLGAFASTGRNTPRGWTVFQPDTLVLQLEVPGEIRCRSWSGLAVLTPTQLVTIDQGSPRSASQRESWAPDARPAFRHPHGVSILGVCAPASRLATKTGHGQDAVCRFRPPIRVAVEPKPPSRYHEPRWRYSSVWLERGIHKP